MVDLLTHGGQALVRPFSLLWLNVVSDSLIAAAYLFIPFTLSYFVRKRSGPALRRPMMIFAIFMGTSGFTHLLLVWNVWHSNSWMEGSLKALTAVASVIAAIAAYRMAPMILKMALPSELALFQDSLSGEREGRRVAEEKLKLLLQAQLLVSEDKLRVCFEGASQAILALWDNGCIALLNQRTEQMFGYSRIELLGHEFQLLLPERFHADYISDRDRFFADGAALSGRRKDGTEFPIEVGLSHVDTPEGPLAFGMVSDISERKKAAGDLERANENLRRSIVELEQFARIASHDLQEPLRMVASYLQLIERRYAALLDEEGREFIAFAVDGAKRMKAMIQGLLELSRAGGCTPKPQMAEGGALVSAALHNLKTAIDEAEASITVDPLPELVVDPVLLTQVFQNLIANAIKFHKDAPPSVNISARREGSDWVFSVRDHGIGIEARHQDRIFQIFERLHPIEEYSGSGIGLSIAKKIVERHGGKIWVESQPGTGSSFYFSINAGSYVPPMRGSGSGGHY